MISVGNVANSGNFTLFDFLSSPSIPPIPSLPVPSFGAANLAAWFDSAQFTHVDNVGYPTISAMEDISGNGFSIFQGDKSLQPIVGLTGAPTNNGLGIYLNPQPGLNGWINGASKVSVWARVKLRSDLYTGSAKRCLLAISEAAATATPPGSGSAVERLAIYLSGGANRKLYKTVAVKDGAQRSSSTTLGPQVPNDVWATIGVEIDLTGVSASVDLYLNSGTPARNELWTPAEALPWAFSTSDPVILRIGDNQAANSPFYGEMRGLIVLTDVPDATRRGQIITYLGGLS